MDMCEVRASPLVGAILAGGRSRRFGRDKTLAWLHGIPMIEHVARRLRPQIDAMIVAAGSNAGRLRGLGLTVVPDGIAGGIGPLAGVLSALDWASATLPLCRHVLTVPADSPFVPHDLAHRLAAARPGRATIVQAVSGGVPNPIVALWPVALRDALRDAILRRGIRSAASFARDYGPIHVDLGADDMSLFDIDTLSDLHRAEAMLPRGGEGIGEVIPRPTMP